jgi:hypothetical protein
MALAENYNELKKIDDITSEKILQSLLKSDKDISMKTELPNPSPLVKLEVLADYLESEKFKESAKVIRGLVKSYETKMVSFKRKGRIEIVNAISAEVVKKTRGMMESLLGVKE